MALSTRRPAADQWQPHVVPNDVETMSWEELTRLSDRELLLLLHQRVDNLEKSVQPVIKSYGNWTANIRFLAVAWGAILSIVGILIGAKAAGVI